MAGIECALINQKNEPVVYLDETSTLALTLKNASGADVPLTGGAPVPETAAGNGTTLIYLMLSGLVTDPASVAVSCPCWTVQKQDSESGAVWCLARDANAVLKKDTVLSITLGNIAVTGKAEPRNIAVDVYAMFEDAWAQQPSVMVQNDPGHLRPLSIDFTVIEPRTVYITEDPNRPMTCSLVFRLTNPSPDTPIVPDGVNWGTITPSFKLSFVYATSGSGAGALTSAERAKSFTTKTLSIADSVKDGDNRWAVALNTQGSPYLTLTPNQLTNKQILGIKEAAKFEFLLDNIVTQLTPGTTLAYLQWTGIPGYQDGYRTVELVKAKPTPGILGFMSLSPSNIRQGTEVLLNWQTFALRKQTLSWIQDRNPCTREVPASAASYKPDPQPDDDVTYTLDGEDLSGNKVPNRQQTVSVIANAPLIKDFAVAPVVAPFEGDNPNVQITGTWCEWNAVTSALNGNVGASPKTIPLNVPGEVVLTVKGRQNTEASASTTVFSVAGYVTNFVSKSSVPCGSDRLVLRDELTFIAVGKTGTWTFAMDDPLAGRRVVESQDFTWSTAGATVTLKFAEGGSATLSCAYGTLTLTGREGRADAHGLMPLVMAVQTGPGHSAPVFTAVSK